MTRTQSSTHTAISASGPVPAIWHDGKTAAAHQVVVYKRRTSHTEELRICSPGDSNDMRPLAIWSLEETCFSHNGYKHADSGTVRLQRIPNDGQRLVTDTPEAATMLASWLKGATKRQKSSTLRRWVISAVAVWLVCVALFLCANALFSLAASIIPRTWEERLGATSRDNIVNMLTYLPDVEGINSEATEDPGLIKLIGRLSEAAPVDGYTFDLIVLDATFVNAFALPGGYMVVSTGLIRFCDNPDELAGVIGHEMTHIVKRHGTGRLLREYTLTTALRLIIGSDAVPAVLAQEVIRTSFDRDDEREADALGVTRTALAGINPRGMGNFFNRLEEEESGRSSTLGGLEGYVSSHPNSKERQENILRLAKNIEADIATEQPDKVAPDGSIIYSPAMTDAEWEHLLLLSREK